jgi:hypothetical protein
MHVTNQAIASMQGSSIKELCQYTGQLASAREKLNKNATLNPP